MNQMPLHFIIVNLLAFSFCVLRVHASPRIDSLALVGGGETMQAGSLVDITGTNFSTVTSSLQVYGPSGDTGKYKATSCEILQNNTKIRCTIVDGVGKNLNLS